MMSVVFAVVMIRAVLTVLVYQMVIMYLIIVTYVMLTALMTVYRIVLVHGVVAQLMMSVVFAVVTAQVVKTVQAYQMVIHGKVIVVV